MITLESKVVLIQSGNLSSIKREKALLICIFRRNTDREIEAYRSLFELYTNARGVRKVTIGITGLWRPRVQIDVAF